MSYPVSAVNEFFQATPMNFLKANFYVGVADFKKGGKALAECPAKNASFFLLMLIMIYYALYEGINYEF